MDGIKAELVMFVCTEIIIAAVAFAAGVMGVWPLFAAFSFFAVLMPLWLIAISVAFIAGTKLANHSAQAQDEVARADRL